MFEAFPDADPDLHIDFPDDLGDALNLVNRLFCLNITLIDTDGTVYCLFNTEDSVSYMENDTGSVVLFVGIMRTSVSFNDMKQASDFIKGVFFHSFLFRKRNEIETLLNAVSRSSSLEDSAKLWIRSV